MLDYPPPLFLTSCPKYQNVFIYLYMSLLYFTFLFKLSCLIRVPSLSLFLHLLSAHLSPRSPVTPGHPISSYLLPLIYVSPSHSCFICFCFTFYFFTPDACFTFHSSFALHVLIRLSVSFVICHFCFTSYVSFMFPSLLIRSF